MNQQIKKVGECHCGGSAGLECIDGDWSIACDECGSSTKYSKNLDRIMDDWDKVQEFLQEKAEIECQVEPSFLGVGYEYD